MWTAVCATVRKRLRAEAYRSLNTTPSPSSRRLRLSLDYYSEQADASGCAGRWAGDICMTYAQNSPAQFQLDPDGGHRTEKTHLSLAIANAAIEKEFGVAYGSGTTLFETGT